MFITLMMWFWARRNFFDLFWIKKKNNWNWNWLNLIQQIIAILNSINWKQNHQGSRPNESFFVFTGTVNRYACFASTAMSLVYVAHWATPTGAVRVYIYVCVCVYLCNSGIKSYVHAIRKTHKWSRLGYKLHSYGWFIDFSKITRKWTPLCAVVRNFHVQLSS